MKNNAFHTYLAPPVFPSLLLPFSPLPACCEGHPKPLLNPPVVSLVLVLIFS